MDTVKIYNVIYQATRIVTAESSAADGMPGTASLLKENGNIHYYLRRPKGKRLYFAVLHSNTTSGNPVFSSVTSLG